MPWLVKNKNDSLVHTGIGNHKYVDKYRDRNGNWQYIYETRVGEGDKSDTTDHVGPNHKSPTGPSSDVARYTDKTSDTSTTKGHGNATIGVYKRTAAENAKHLQEVRSNMLRNRPTYKNGIPDNATQPVAGDKAKTNAKHLQEVRSNMLRNRPTYKNGIPDNATGVREKAEEHARQVAEAERRNKPTGIPANATKYERNYDKELSYNNARARGEPSLWATREANGDEYYSRAQKLPENSKKRKRLIERANATWIGSRTY